MAGAFDSFLPFDFVEGPFGQLLRGHDCIRAAQQKGELRMQFA